VSISDCIVVSSVSLYDCVCVSVCLSLYISVFVFVCVSLCLSVYVSLCVFLFVCVHLELDRKSPNPLRRAGLSASAELLVITFFLVN